MTQDRYYRNKNYSLVKKGNYYFEVEGCPVLHVDGIIAKIWELCEGRTFQEIYMQINLEGGVSSYLLYHLLSLMLKSDLVQNGVHLQDNHSSGGENGRIEGPLVSIVILNYNGEIHLRGCLDSIRFQTYRHLETIVVDNASKDSSLELLQNEYPWVNFIGLKKNMGFPAGNNIGIKHAQGDYIFLLNNDTLLDSHCIEQAILPFLIDEKIAAVGPKIRFFPLTHFINSYGNSLRDRGFGSDNFFGHLDLGQHDHLREVFSVCFAGVLLNRKAIVRVGLLDPNYFMYYEDVDWCFRARHDGWKVVVAPKALMYHKFGASLKGLPYSFKLRLILINRMRFVLKNLQLKTGLRWMKNYFKEDLFNFLNSWQRWQYPLTFTYISVYFRLIFLLPKELLKRGRSTFIHSKGHLDDHEILRYSLTEEEGLIDSEGIPLLNISIVRDYYMHLPSQQWKDKILRERIP